MITYVTNDICSMFKVTATFVLRTAARKRKQWGQNIYEYNWFTFFLKLHQSKSKFASYLLATDAYDYLFSDQKLIIFRNISFIPFFFWFLDSFDDEVIKIQKYYIIFVYILQGKKEKTKKKITQLNDQNTKNKNMGLTEHLTPSLGLNRD